MLKKNQVILGLLIIAVFVGITSVAVLVRAGGGGGIPNPQISGAVTYPVPNWPYVYGDKVVLFDSTGSNRIDEVPIQGGGGKHWYNELVPPNTGHYYVQGIGANCCSVQYYIYWQGQSLGQDIVMDQPNEPQK